MYKLNQLRGRKGLTQKQLADELGCSKMQITLLEKNISAKNVHTDFIKKICDFFDVKPYELYGIDILRIVPEDKNELKQVINMLQEEYDKWEE